MQEFKSWRSYWDFERITKTRTRYVHDPEIETFLTAVLETGQKRIETIPSGAFLWRAQIGHDLDPLYERDRHIDDIEAPYPPHRMKGTATSEVSSFNK